MYYYQRSVCISTNSYLNKYPISIHSILQGQDKANKKLMNEPMIQNRKTLDGSSRSIHPFVYLSHLWLSLHLLYKLVFGIVGIAASSRPLWIWSAKKKQDVLFGYNLLVERSQPKTGSWSIDEPFAFNFLVVNLFISYILLPFTSLYYLHNAFH
jgi:hypothetical protein